MTKDIDDTPLKFGKHAGLTPNEVAEKDPSYIVWMYDEFDEPPCSEDLYEECSDRHEDLYDRLGD